MFAQTRNWLLFSSRPRGDGQRSSLRGMLWLQNTSRGGCENQAQPKRTSRTRVVWGATTLRATLHETGHVLTQNQNHYPKADPGLGAPEIRPNAQNKSSLPATAAHRRRVNLDRSRASARHNATTRIDPMYHPHPNRTHIFDFLSLISRHNSADARQSGRGRRLRRTRVRPQDYARSGTKTCIRVETGTRPAANLQAHGSRLNLI